MYFQIFCSNYNLNNYRCVNNTYVLKKGELIESNFY